MKQFFQKNRIKLKPTLQIAQTECGLCCVRTILEGYGYDISLAELRQIKEPGRDGLGMHHLRQLFTYFKMSAKTYRIQDIKALAVIKLPVIAFWKGYHFVCIESFNGHEAVIMDPSVGRIKITKEEFIKDFDQYIIAAEPALDFRPYRVKPLERWNKNYIWPSGLVSLYAKIIIISSILAGMALAIPVFTQIIIDKGINDLLSFTTILVSLSVATLIMVLFNFLKATLSINLTYRFSWHLVSNAFVRVLSLPAKYFTVRTPGEIVYRLNALTRIQDILGANLVQAFLDIISGMAVLGYVFYISPLLGGLVLLVVLSFFVFLITSQTHVSVAMDKELHEGSTAQSIQLDAIVSINSVKLGGYVQAYIRDWGESFKKSLASTSYRMRIQQGIIGSTLAGIQGFAPLIILVISLYMVKLGAVSIGQAIAVQSITSLLFSYANSVFTTISEVMIATRYIELAEDIFEYPIEKYRESSQHMPLGTVSVKNLTFNYTSDGVSALKNISIDIADGETIALVGLSGSGKTTLGKILSTLFEPTTGTIYFGGIEYHDYNLDTLRSSISYIPQEAHLHNRTIMENLQLGSKHTESEIKEICASLDFLGFIQDLPMGYNTVISEMGANLSGGQRQRIHIARVLLQTPKILVMDEATSSLDNISQSAVYGALSDMNCTKIVIAHRFATILNADRIIVLEEGQIAQSGSHEELLRQGGLYTQLFSSELEKEMK